MPLGTTLRIAGSMTVGGFMIKVVIGGDVCPIGNVQSAFVS
jgi:hypothetical protein